MTQGNILYLLNTGTNTYNIYALISGTPTKIASTTIDLSQYAKLSDLNNYYDKATSDGKYATITTVDGKVDKTSILSTISSTPSDDKLLSEKAINDTLVKKTDIVDNLISTDTDKPLSANQGKVLKDELDLKANNSEVVKKTDITTTIDSTSTDTQVPSASAIYHKSKNGITEILTNNDIIAYADTIGAQMVTDTVKIMNGINSPYGADNISNDFHYTIYNINNENFKRIVAYDIRKNDMYMIIKRNGTWSAWQRVCTTSVADVAPTTITFTDTTNYKPSAVVGFKYTVINGICYVSGGITCVSPTSSETLVYTFPKPKAEWQYCKTIGVIKNIDDTNTVTMIIGKNGELNLTKGVAGGEYRCTFSYPVAEP